MFNRSIINDLQDWSKRKNRKPLVLRGAPGIVNYVAGIQSEVFNVKDIADAWRGNVAEHIFGQELLSGKNNFSAKRNYWLRDAHASDAEIDFIIQYDSLLIPVEVKSGHNSNLRSLHQFMDVVEHQIAIRIWSGKFSIDKVSTPKGKAFSLYNVPFYYTGILEKLFGK